MGMVRGNWKRLALVAAALTNAVSPSPRRAVAQPPLRHDFRTGDWLVYEFKAAAFSLATGELLHRRDAQVQLWCFEREHEKALVLLDVIPIIAGGGGPMRGAIFSVDKRGERTLSPATQRRLAAVEAAFAVIPVLRSALSSELTWQSSPDHDGCRRLCTRTGPDAAANGHIRVEYRVEDPTGVFEARGVSRTGVFWFDPTAHVVSRVESREEDRTAGVRTDTVIKLRHRTRNQDNWSALRAAEARRYVRMLQTEDRLHDAILREPGKIELRLTRLARLWTSFVADIDAGAKSPLRLLAEARRRRLEQDAHRVRARARYVQQWLGRTAPPWTLQTPTGRTLASEALRDQTVVECFWSSAAAAGPRILPSVRRLQDGVADEGMKIVCLNMDDDFVRSRQTANIAGKGLTHVLAASLAPVAELPELPVFRLIDRSGRIRRIVFGRPSDLAAALGLGPE